MKLSIVVLASIAAYQADARLFKRQQPPSNPPASQQPQVSEQSIWSLLQNSTQLSIFTQEVEKFPELSGLMAGNVSTYRNQSVQSLTVFAPINQAWLALPNQLRDALVNAPSLPDLQKKLPVAIQQQQQPPSQKPAVNETRVGEFRQATSLEQALLSYHMHNGTFDVGAYLSNQSSPSGTSSSPNTTLSSLLAPFNLTIWQSMNEQNPQQSPSMGELLPAVSPQSFINSTGAYVNDARILGGVRAQNGILYLVDSVVSPLWYMNITLQNLPRDLTLPQLVTAMLM